MHDLAEPPRGVGYTQALRHRWRAIVTLVAVTVVAAIAYTVRSPDHYEAEAVLRVSPLSSSDSALASIDLFKEASSNVQSSVLTLARLLESPQVVDDVKSRLGTSNRRSTLKKVKISPAVQDGTVSVVATATSAVEASRIANAFADAIISSRARSVQRDIATEIKRLEGQLPNVRQGGAAPIRDRLAELDALVGTGDPTLRVLTPAVPPETASSRPLPLIVLIAVLTALLVGIGAALMAELVFSRLHEDDEILRRIPILARIRRARRSVVRSYMTGGGNLPPSLWEAYRILRARLWADDASFESAPKSILITSAIQGEGKTMTSVNLAIALAAAGRRVVLIDGDLRSPAVARVFGLPPGTIGFAELLAGSVDPRSVLIPAPGYGDRLQLVLAGSERPLDLVEPRRIRMVLETLGESADVVVLDSPALTDFADSTVLADAVDVVVVAARLGRSRRDKLAELNRLLVQGGITPAGLVLTELRRTRAAPEPAPRIETQTEVEEASAGSATVRPATGLS